MQFNQIFVGTRFNTIQIRQTGAHTARQFTRSKRWQASRLRAEEDRFLFEPYYEKAHPYENLKA
jgi:hypothetical protein